ncbi:galectin-3 [Platysternon megacephalum]|uniref:Surfactant protein C n=1 Tax=Platysternon megacephalum TaxID=55544 RepID=A0A4D9E8Q8_9SAUR|nr:galectin-3 [Platysternon megacephalum]
MDSKGSPESNMPAEPPAYRFMPAVPKNRKEVILISVVVFLLAIIITGAILIGVHMTQKHTEKIIQITSSGSNGEMTEQTMMVSSQENVAAFHVEGNTTSATVVYDYKHGLIGLRVQGRRKCLVVKMDKVAIPSLAEMIQRIENFATQQGPGDDNLSYTFSEGQLADHTALGMTLNILCSDVPIYWAESTQKQQRRWSIYVHFWGITIYISSGR